jgi:hypothetical protein
MEFVTRAGQPSKPHAFKSVVDFKVSKTHLDALTLIARLEEALCPHQPSCHIAGVFLQITGNMARGRVGTAGPTDLAGPPSGRRPPTSDIGRTGKGPLVNRTRCRGPEERVGRDEGQSRLDALIEPKLIKQTPLLAPPRHHRRLQGRDLQIHRNHCSATPSTFFDRIDLDRT